MKKIFSIAILSCLLITVACQTAPKDEFSGQLFSYSSQELFEQEVMMAKDDTKNGEEVAERILYIKDAVTYMPDEFYLTPTEGTFNYITLNDSIMGVSFYNNVGEKKEYKISWNLEYKKAYTKRIKENGGYNYLPGLEEQDGIRSLYTKVAVDGLQYTIERMYSSKSAVEYKKSIGEPLTQEKIDTPIMMHVYWEQDNALVEYIVLDENLKKEMDDAVIVSSVGKLQKVYYNTNHAA